ncbi:RDD family protein [Danxiaibacter flavus]|uniref:RDD family protein n=1 Tax=Danxiaibacter flavus TaxID=3049108 RepID=A0ABV3ZM58_9BACT|nr:RDD family protein [Chitinophagaceae bacterium DXS]
MDTERYRTGSKRFWAAVVDGIVFMPILLVDRYLITSATNKFVLLTWQTFSIFIPVFYSIIAHYKYGQTVGKWVTGVKVLDVTETRNISLQQSFLRESVYLLVELTGFLYYVVSLLRSGEFQYRYIETNDFASNFVFVWTLLELITMLTNSKRRAVHDFIAKSVVVRKE